MDVAGQFYGLEALIVPNKWLIVPSNLNKFIQRGGGAWRGGKKRRFRGTYFECKKVKDDELHPVNYYAIVSVRLMLRRERKRERDEIAVELSIVITFSVGNYPNIKFDKCLIFCFLQSSTR